MTDDAIIAHRRPGLARIIVALLATVLAFLGTVAIVNVAQTLGWKTLATGTVLMMPLTSAWIATALCQRLMRKDSPHG